MEVLGKAVYSERKCSFIIGYFSCRNKLKYIDLCYADHLMSMKMIDEAHARKGKIKAFTSYCGGLPSPAAANNPLAYKFR